MFANIDIEGGTFPVLQCQASLAVPDCFKPGVHWLWACAWLIAKKCACIFACTSAHLSKPIC